MNELVSDDAVGLGERIRKKEILPKELLEETIEHRTPQPQN